MYNIRIKCIFLYKFWRTKIRLNFYELEHNSDENDPVRVRGTGTVCILMENRIAAETNAKFIKSDRV